MKKRLLSALLAIAMIFTMMPTVFAIEDDGTAPTSSKVFEVVDKAALDAAIAEAKDGDTIKLTADITSDSVLVIDKAITLDLGENTLTTTNGWGGLQLKNGCSVKNGKLLHTGRVNAIKVWDVVSIEDLVIEVTDTTENKTVGGIAIQENAAGVDTIKNVTMQGAGLDYGIETYNCGNATEPVIGSMENVTIDAKGTGMLISAPCGTATNCSFKGGVSGIEIWIKGTYSATLDLVKCEVEGGEQPVYAHDEFSSNPDIENVGTLKLTADEDTTFANDDDVLMTLTIARAKNVDVSDLTDKAVAEMAVDENTTIYYTTATGANTAKGEIWTAEDLAAFAKAVDNGKTFAGETVYLMADIDLDNELFNPIGSYRKDTAFKGTFEGNGKTISNLSQNTWALENGYYYDDLGLGLFGLVEDATIKNLTIDGAEISGESAICGTVAACAYGDSVFENITIRNANVADYQYYAGGIVGWASGNHQYINCDVEESTTIGSQWGDFNNANGGLIGGSSASATIYLQDCDVACRLDAHNDVVSAYEWYTYRSTGMLIGNTKHTATDEAVTNAAAPNVTAVNCTVTYGDWAHYHYCQFSNMNYPWVRAEGGLSVDPYSNVRYGHPNDANGNKVVDANHVHAEGDAHHEVIVLDQLFGGLTGDRYATYGEPAHEGVTVIYPVVDHGLQALVDNAENGGTITLTKDLCEICGAIVNKNIFVDGAEGDVIAIDTDTAFAVVEGGQVSIIGGTYAVKPTKYVAEGYKAYEYTEGVWTVERDYVEWIKAELLAGRSVTLERDIEVDGSYIDSIPASTNGNGEYFNPGIFNVVGENSDVTFDLDGHTITYKGHADAEYTATYNKDKYYNEETGEYSVNSCAVAHGLFFANAGANLTIVDSSVDKSGAVEVYGVASGVYSASPDSIITVKGGTWTNEGCAECGGTNLFLYASHGGELYIKGGTFDQALDAEGNSYLIVEHGGSASNEVVDFSKTKIEISGGTFVGMNPESAVYCDQAGWGTQNWSTTNVVADGYKALEIEENVWIIVENGVFVVTFDDGTGETEKVLTNGEGKLDEIPSPNRDGYKFLGWYLADGTPVTTDTVFEANTRVIANWVKVWTVEFDSNGGSAVADQIVVDGETAVRPANPTRSGYDFDGWELNGQNFDFSTPVTSDITLVADWDRDKVRQPSSSNNDKDETTIIEDPDVPLGLNTGDHFQYIVGDTNGLVRPLAKITRAEVAAIFYRLLDDTTRTAFYAEECGLPDLNASKWYNEEACTLVNAGILTGCGDGLFHGERNITRGELATIIAKFDAVTYVGEDKFDDISGHWAREFINISAENGWIVGDGTGKFRPYDEITRAEVMTIVNAVLNRAVDEAGLIDDYKVWPDNTPGTWYYYQVIEATNYHSYELDSDMTEEWTEILPDKVWNE